MNSVTIFGGCGFIGLYLAEELINLNLFEKIYLVDIKEPQNNLCELRYLDLLKSQKVCFINADVRNNLSNIDIKSNVNLIINLAAIHKEPGHKDNEYYETNIKGADNVCEFAEMVGCKNIIFTSSIAPYGIEDKLKDESTIPKPVTPYGSSKLQAEKIHIAWQKKEGANRILTIVRPGIVFGKYENANMYRLVKLVHKRFFFYMGNKNTAKASIYIKELLNQIIWVNDKQNKNELKKNILFNATTWPNPTIQAYVKTTCKVSNINRFIPSVPYPFLLSVGYIFEYLFKIVGKKNLFSPVRLRKLVRSNLIKPSFLIKNNYKFRYSLETAFEEWKKEDKETWK
tara:strand:+ start:85 stop:1110 length:1026 start_codon:yes stop_codon:yes gene_type:complete